MKRFLLFLLTFVAFLQLGLSQSTEAITISVRHFLNIALLNNTKDAYEALSPENRDLLDINSPDDVKKIIRSLKDIICYELVKTIKQ